MSRIVFRFCKYSLFTYFCSSTHGHQTIKQLWVHKTQHLSHAIRIVIHKFLYFSMEKAYSFRIESFIRLLLFSTTIGSINALYVHVADRFCLQLEVAPFTFLTTRPADVDVATGNMTKVPPEWRRSTNECDTVTYMLLLCFVSSLYFCSMFKC